MFVQSALIEYMTGELLARISDPLEMQINFTLFQHEYLCKFQLNRIGWCNCQCARFECGNIVGSSSGRVKPKTVKFVFVTQLSLAQHAALRKKSKDLLDRNQDNVFVRMMQHVYPWTVVSVNQHCTNPTKQGPSEMDKPEKL